MSITHDLRETLNEREKRIYALLCDNLTNKEIASLIGVGVDAIKWNLANIYRKLGIEPMGYQKSRRSAIFYAGTKIEQRVEYGEKGEQGYSLKQIKLAAKRSGLSLDDIEDLISFLEME